MSTTYLYEKELARARRRGGHLARRRVLVRLLRTRAGHSQLAYEDTERVRFHEVPEQAAATDGEQVVPEQQTLQQRWEELSDQIDDLEYERRRVRDLMIEVERYVVEGSSK